MPSPFLGMDPYLEATTYWRDFHTRLLTYSADALQPTLAPNYLARIEERIYLNSGNRQIVPDVLITTEKSDYQRRDFAPTLDFVLDEPLIVKNLYDAPPERYLEIIDAQSGELVTVIEVLSPSNKVGEGKRQYEKKIAELRGTETNIVEIDLIGIEKASIWNGRGKMGRLTARYAVRIHRYDNPTEQELYAIALSERLPRIRVPLLPQDPDVGLNLPLIFDKCYDNGGYGRQIDYRRPPEAFLDSAKTQYIDQLLRETGLRT